MMHEADASEIIEAIDWHRVGIVQHRSIYSTERGCAAAILLGILLVIRRGEITRPWMEARGESPRAQQASAAAHSSQSAAPAE